MATIKINDLNEAMTIGAQEMEHVKGGPHYTTWDVGHWQVAPSTAKVSDVTLKRG